MTSYDSPYRRSPSPQERGLQTSHRALSRLKDGHQIGLRTNPGEEDPLLGGLPSPGSVGRGGDGATPQRPYPGQGGGLDRSPVYEEAPGRGADGLHYSHQGFSQEKQYHDTGIMSRARPAQHYSGVPPTRGRSGSPHEPSVAPPWASVNDAGTPLFQQPLPPTRYGGTTAHPNNGKVAYYALGSHSGGAPPSGSPTSPTPYRSLAGGGSSPRMRQGGFGSGLPGGGGGAAQPHVDDPVYEWQNGAIGGGERGGQPNAPPFESRLRQSFHDTPPRGMGAAQPPAPLRVSEPPPAVPGGVVSRPEPFADLLREGVSSDGGRVRDFYVYSLSGQWVSRPGGEEVLQVTHVQSDDRLAGVATKAAPWSEVQEGESVEGRILSADGVPQVELRREGRPVLRLYPELQEDGRLLLLPSRGTVGSSGYWEVLPSSVTGGSTPLYNPQHNLDVSYSVDNAELYQNGSTVINIYT